MVDGEGHIVAAVEEERFTRVRHAKAAQVGNPNQLPLRSIAYCLQRAGITMAQVSHIGYALTPKKRLKNTDLDEYVVDGDWGSRSGEQHFYDQLQTIPAQLEKMGFRGQFHWLDHHLCHAASCFYPAPYEQAAILTVDGIGELSSSHFARGDGSKLHVLGEVDYPNSLGFLWEKISKLLGFTEYDACKVMSLAAFGDPAAYHDEFAKIISFTADGAFVVDNSLLRFRVEEYGPLEELFSMPRRRRESQFTASHYNVSAALQVATEEALLHMARHLHDKTGLPNLCCAGGVMLNCLANRRFYEEGPFERLYIQAAANDAGVAVGAALLIHNHILGLPYHDVMSHVYLGPEFDNFEIEQELKARKLTYSRPENIAHAVAKVLSESATVGWFQGAMEFGPRALGNRSLLADPRDNNTRQIISELIKHRDTFRPFAPSILAEQAKDWFVIKKETLATDFMLLAYPIKPEKRAWVPAVLHIDGTARIQTVRRETNPRYHAMLTEFYRLTDVPMVLNTSFNDNEPIVCKPEEAVATYLNTAIDYLAIGDFLVGPKPDNPERNE